MTTVVTGASGFIGGAVVRALLDEGHDVRAVDLVRGPTLDGLDVEFVETDVLEPTEVAEAISGADAVYHLAAVISITGDPTGAVRRVNVGGVRNVARAALNAGVRRMVHCSSVHAFDLKSGGGTITENSPKATAPGLPPYDRSKAAGEGALQEVIGDGLDAVIVNPTGVLGPLDHAPSRTGQAFLAMFNGRLPALVDGGFDWVDSRDVARAILTVDRSGKTGENYLLPGHYRTLGELAELAEAVSGTRAPSRTVPMWAARMWSPIGDVLGRRSGSALTFTRESLHALEDCPAISGQKAADTLGHRPRPIEETVNDIYAWFKDQGLVHSSSS